MSPRLGRLEQNRHAVVIGASLAGVFAATALARNGWTVTVLERDRLPASAEHRRGVPQDRQAHILLHRGLLAIEGLLPGFRAELLARGGVPFDTGQVPWLGDHGWLSTDLSSWEVVSATRPLMDAVALHLLRLHTSVTLRDGVRVTRLESVPGRWRVGAVVDAEHAGTDPDRTDLTGAVVVDASGRGSRLSRWLPGLTGSELEQIDAHVGYAGQLHAAREPLPLRTGIVIFGTSPDGTSGLALPVERGQWMISASGMDDRRPPRDPSGFHAFLDGLRDPAVADLVARLEPVGDIALHRQTGNRRYGWGRRPDWPAGLLVLGDALCSFNPIYGQGITVAALQAEMLGAALSAGQPVDGRLQRRLRSLTDVPWSISTGNDLKFPSCPQQPSRSQQVIGAFTDRLGRLAAAGNVRATRTFSDVYHLMSPPSTFFHPALLAAAARPLPDRRLPRPAVLDELSRRPQMRPPVGPADA